MDPLIYKFNNKSNQTFANAVMWQKVSATVQVKNIIITHCDLRVHPLVTAAI